MCVVGYLKQADKVYIFILFATWILLRLPTHLLILILLKCIKLYCIDSVYFIFH